MGLERAKNFSWEKCAKEMVSYMQKETKINEETGLIYNIQ